MARVRTVLREERFTFLLTTDEREAIDTAAAEVGLDRSAYIRSVLFGRMQRVAAVRPLRESAPARTSS